MNFLQGMVPQFSSFSLIRTKQVFLSFKGSFLESKAEELQNLGKSKLVAWFVSNCETHSERELYVEKLKQFIDVDIYGLCGSMSCSRYKR